MRRQAQFKRSNATSFVFIPFFVFMILMIISGSPSTRWYASEINADSVREIHIAAGAPFTEEDINDVVQASNANATEGWAKRFAEEDACDTRYTLL